MAEFVINYGGWQGYDWTGRVTIWYETSYDPISNATTVILGESAQHSYSGVYNYYTHSTLDITVRANDSGSSGTASGSYTSTTNGGWDNYYSYPSPRVITVQHNNTAGEKSVTISASSMLRVHLVYDDYSTTYASGSTSIQTGTYTPTYALSINAGTGSAIVVNRTSSSIGGTGNLSNGATLYQNDVLKITFGANEGYALKTHTVNDSTFTSGNSHTVSGNVVIVSTAERQGIIYIDNGSGWDAYQVYIDNGSSWDMYIPYIDNGSGWDIYS